MDQRRKARTTLLSEYKKYHFLNVEHAQHAKEVLEAQFRTTIFKTSKSGSLFFKTTGSTLFDLKVANAVHALGGVEA